LTKQFADLKGVVLDEVAERYLASKKPSTAASYRGLLKRFRVFYGRDLSEFLEEVEEWREKNKTLPITERRRYAEDVARDLIAWLKEKGYSNNAIRGSLTALQNFLKYYEIPLTYSFIDIPPPTSKKSNGKLRLKRKQIKEFVDSAEYPRDKAVIVCLFQSGLSLGDLLNIDYGDIREELEGEALPLMICLNRGKTDEEFKTFFGADALNYLKLYLGSRRDLGAGSPLFAKLGSSRRATDGAIQNNFRKYADKISWIDVADYNPARPHSLRAAFRSRLTGKMDPDLIEFMMGHALGPVKRAYLNIPDDELRELYAQFEHELSIETTSKKLEAGIDGKTSKVEEKYRKKIEDLETTLQTQATQISQIAELSSRLDREMRELEAKNTEKDTEMMREVVALKEQLRGIISRLERVQE